jgi:hypothetical protein
VNDGHGSHGFLRDAGGEITTFDPAGSKGTLVRALNDSGEAAGDFNDGSANLGFIRDAGGSITLIDPLGSNSVTVNALNNGGAVAGDFFQGGMFHGFVATASVPEPTTLTLLSIGIAGMAGYAWRRKKQQAKV